MLNTSIVSNEETVEVFNRSQVVIPTKTGFSTGNANLNHMDDFEKGDYIIVVDLDHTLVYSQPVAASKTQVDLHNESVISNTSTSFFVNVASNSED